MKFIISFNDFLNESLNTPVIYHFTTISNFAKMLENNDFYLKSVKSYISFSRNYNMQSSELRADKRAVRLTIDARKLSHRYRIEPFKDPIFDLKDEEHEERIIKKNRFDSVNIKGCILRVDIKNEPPYDEVNTDQHTRIYQFGENDYVSDFKTIRRRYFEYYRDIEFEYAKQLRNGINLNIHFVDKFQRYGR